MTAPSLSARQRPSIELSWFADCPNHAAARQMLIELVPVHAPGAVIRIIDATDPTVAASHRFPGSPTIRVDGLDIDPGFVDPGDYTPGCDSRNEKAVAVWRAATDAGVNRSDSVYEWLRR